MKGQTKRLAPLLVAAGCLLISGCTLVPGFSPFPNTPVLPPPGFIFTNYKAPLTVDFKGDELGSKKGSASTMYLHEPFLQTSWAWGDVSIEAAAQNGGIKEVTYADYEVLAVLGLFGRFTIYAHGN